MKDPIVEEVRQIRLKIEQDCVKAGTSYKDHLLDVQKQYESRLVSPPTGEIARENSGNIHALKITRLGFNHACNQQISWNELMEDWELCRRSEMPKPIEPLE